MKPKIIALSVLFVLLGLNASRAQIVNIENSRLSETQQGWQGLIDFRFNAVKNNIALLQLSNKLRLQYTQERNRVLFLSDLNLSISDDLSFERNAFQHIRYGYMVDSIFILESFVQNQFDRIQLINQRTLLGQGVRFRYLQRGIIRSFFGFTYMLEYEDELITERQNLNSRLSSYLNLKLSIENWFSLYNTTYFQPLMLDWSDYRISSNSLLEIRANESFSVTFNINVVYDSNPVDDPSVQNLNFKFSNGFAFNL